MAKVTIPIPKAKATIEVDTQEICTNDKEEHNRIIEYVLMLGFKTLLSRGMTQIAVAGLEGDDLVAKQLEAFKKAQSNWEDLKVGKVRMTGVKKTKGGDRAVTTEARRIARELVKKTLKENNEKVSHYSAKAITEAADALIQENEWITEQAKENLKNVAEKAEKATKVDLTGLTPDPKKVKAAEEAKSKKKGAIPLSKLQAGKPARHHA